MKDQKIKAFIKYFADFFDLWDYQSKIAMITVMGLTIALFCLIPFRINVFVLFGSTIGVWISAIVFSNKISKEGHQEQEQQQ
jgi:hypothetical protein